MTHTYTHTNLITHRGVALVPWGNVGGVREEGEQRGRVRGGGWWFSEVGQNKRQAQSVKGDRKKRQKQRSDANCALCSCVLARSLLPVLPAPASCVTCVMQRRAAAAVREIDATSACDPQGGTDARGRKRG